MVTKIVITGDSITFEEPLATLLMHASFVVTLRHSLHMSLWPFSYFRLLVCLRVSGFSLLPSSQLTCSQKGPKVSLQFPDDNCCACNSQADKSVYLKYLL